MKPAVVFYMFGLMVLSACAGGHSSAGPPASQDDYAVAAPGSSTSTSAGDVCANCSAFGKSSSYGNNPAFGRLSGYSLPSLPADGHIFITVVPVALPVEPSPGCPAGPEIWERQIDSYPSLVDVETLLFSDRLVDEEERIWELSPYGSLTEYFREVSGGRLEVDGAIFRFEDNAAAADDDAEANEYSFAFPPGASEYKGYYVPNAKFSAPSPEAVLGFTVDGGARDCCQEALDTLATRRLISTGALAPALTESMDKADTDPAPGTGEVFDCVVFLLVEPQDIGCVYGIPDNKDARRSGFNFGVDLNAQVADSLGTLHTWPVGSAVGEFANAGIPTLCHELLHGFGLPDHYHPPVYPGDGYSIMAVIEKGRVKAVDEPSPYPEYTDAEWKAKLDSSKKSYLISSVVGLTAWQRYLLGWLDPAEIEVLHPSEMDWGAPIQLAPLNSPMAGPAKKSIVLLASDEFDMPSREELSLYPSVWEQRLLMLESRGGFRDQRCDRYLFSTLNAGLTDYRGVIGWYIKRGQSWQEYMRPTPTDILGPDTHQYYAMDNSYASTYLSRQDLYSFWNSQQGFVTGIPPEYVLTAAMDSGVREPICWMPASGYDADGLTTVKVAAANGTTEYPDFIQVLRAYAEPQTIEVEEAVNLRTWVMDSELSYDNPPASYETGNPLRADYYQVIGSTETFLGSGTSWEYGLPFAVNGDLLAGNAELKTVRVRVHNVLRNRDPAPVDLTFRVVGTQIASVGPVNGTPHEIDEEFTNYPDDCFFYHQEESDQTGQTYAAGAVTKYFDQDALPAGSDVVFTGTLSHETIPRPAGYLPNTGTELRGAKLLRFVGSGNFRVEIRLKYHMDSALLANTVWPEVGGPFGDFPSPLVGDQLRVELRKRGMPIWKLLPPAPYSGSQVDVISGPGPLRGISPAWPDYNRIFVDLTSAQLTAYGLHNNDATGSNLGELRIRFLADSVLQYGGVYIDKVFIHQL